MKKADKEMRRLLWLIDFVNLDIDRLTLPDFTKLALEINEEIESELLIVPNEKLYPEIFITSEGKSRLNADKMEMIKTVQKRIRKVFDTIYELKKQKLSRKKFHVLEPALRFSMTLTVHGWDGKFIVGPNSDYFSNALECEVAELIYRCSPEAPRERPLRSLANLKKCQLPTCQKYLWQVHKKEKNYCSNKCAWRAFAASRRAGERKDKEEQKGGI